MTTVVYTDGACQGNPGPGGWAWAVPGGRFAAGCEARSTNQRMEIAAVLDALRSLPGRVEVVSDSTYVVNCFRDGWWEGWISRGWLNKAKKPVANRDLWEPLIDLYQARGGQPEITFRWVKGHSGDPMNDLVDRLAVEAAATQATRAGDEPPDTLGPPDRPGKARAAAAGPVSETGSSAELTGHPLVVVGHKPPALGGYDDNPVLDALRDKLREILTAKAVVHDDLRIVSGLRLGTEMVAAGIAVDEALPLDVVLPYPEPESVWPERSQTAFRTLKAQAARVITLQNRAPETAKQAAQAMSRRDAWLARHVAEAVLVWDGADATLGSVHRLFEQHLDGDVWLVDPAELTARSRGRAR